MDWQPIDTAPTNGVNVLTYSLDGYAVAWSVDGRQWYCGDEEENGFEVQPTHWMKLPASPAA